MAKNLIDDESFSFAEGVLKADFDVHTHSADDIISGILPVVRGGTGAGSIEDVLSAFSLRKVECGQYRGTGKKGATSPRSLTFNITPYLVIIFHNNVNEYLIYKWGQSQACGPTSVGRSNVTIDGTTMSWATVNTNYSTATENQQMDVSGDIYVYVAIG